jgi:hypothetical protein
MSNEIKQCSTCKIYENGTCWKKVINHEDCHVKPTDSCKEYEANPNKPWVTPSKPVVANNTTTDKDDKKTDNAKNSSTTVTK